MGFEVGVNSYRRYMGRYSELLTEPFLEFAGVGAHRRALDVGCGPAVVTAALVERMGASSVAAVDPSKSFVAALKSRLPGVDVRLGVAEELPFADALFDLCVSQLAVHFMADPVGGLAEMARVTRPGGTVAACVWDHDEGSGPFSRFWRAARALDPESGGEPRLPGTWRGHLVELFEAAHLTRVEPGTLTVSVGYRTFDEWWEPLLLGMGHAGGYVAGLSQSRRAELRERCREELPPAPFEISATAWAARGIVV